MYVKKTEPISSNMTHRFSALQPWLVCCTAAFYFFYVILLMSVFNPLSKDLMQAFDINTVQLGNLSASYFYADAIALIPVGLLLDRFSTRHLLLLTLAICVLTTLWFAVSGSLWVAIIARCMGGIGNAFAFLGSMRLVARWFPVQRAAFVMGLVVTIGMLGGVVAQIPFTELITVISWRSAMLIVAVGGGIIWFFMFAFVLDKEQSHAQAPVSKTLWRNLIAVLSRKQNWFCGLYASMLNLSVLLLGALWGNLYLTQARALTATQASLVTSMIFTGLIVGAPTLGWFSDYVRSRRLPMLGGALFSLILILAMLFFHSTWQVLCLLFFLLGFLAAAQVISFPAVTESNPAALTSTALSIVSMLINVSAAILQPIFGWIIKSVSAPTVKIFASGYDLALVILPIGFAIGFWMAYQVRETFAVLEK